MRSGDPSTLFDQRGARKYLTKTERGRFLAALAGVDPRTRAFCLLLVFAGCRISEALAVTQNRLDVETGRVVFRTLKRRRTVFRAVPIPPDLMRELRALSAGHAGDDRLWGWCRQTAWRRVKAIMAAASVDGIQATPKGLRHAFGVANAEGNVPPSLTQRWMGHAAIQTTAIYQQAVGDEERAFAQRLWSQLPD